MSRVLPLLITALALVGVALGIVLFARTPRGPRGPEALAAPTHVAPRDEPAMAPVVASSVPTDPPRPPAREFAQSSLEAELAQAQWLEGRVLFPAGTPPDEEAFVVANGKNFSDGSDHRARVERDGSFRVAFSAKAPYGRIELEARYLFLTEDVPWKSGTSSGPLVLAPQLGARIAGHLRPPAGTEASEVSGTLVLLSSARVGSSYDKPQEIRQDPSRGLEFAFDALFPGRDPALCYELELDGADFVGRSGKLVPEAGRTLELDLELTPGLLLAGVLRDASGVPLAGAKVAASVSPRSRAAASSRRTESGPDGSFRLGALVGGKVELRAELEGFEPLVRDLGRLEQGRSVQDLELVLTRGGSIAGRVVWPDGSPAEAALVLTPLRTSLEDGAGRGEVKGTSDASGEFAISGLSEESYRVTARVTKVEEVLFRSKSTGAELPKKQTTQWCTESEQVAAGTTGLALTLSSGLAVGGRVVDELGVPLAAFSVRASRVESLRSRRVELSQTFQRADGSFLLEGLTPGAWELVARSRGHTDSEPLRLTLPGAESVALVAPRQAWVSGRVLDPTGVPLARATVHREGDGLASASLEIGDDEATDQDGRFELRGLGPGKLVLRAHGAGFAPSPPLVVELEAGKTLSGVDLRLRHGGTILGQLLGSDGRPQTGGVMLAGEGFDASPETDAEGRFEVAGVPPGETFLWAFTAEGQGLEARVTLREGETIRVRLAPPGTTVRLFGHVRAGGEPLVGADLWAIRKAEVGEVSWNSTSESGAEGAYEMQLPGAGPYWLGIQGGNATSLGWRIALDVPSVEAFEFDVSIPLGRITGRVSDADGRALARVLVQSEPGNHEGGAHGSAQGLTDDEGRYELSVPAGRHAVRAGGSGNGFGPREEQPYAETRVEGLVVGENDALRGIDLVLTKGGTLEGVARRADGSSTRVELWSEEGLRPRPLGRTDEGGRFTLEGLTPGTLVLGARGRTTATREAVRVTIVAGETKRVELELVPARLVHLRVREHGVPVGSELCVLDARSQPQPVQTSENGEAWAGPLVPGRYVIRAERDQKRVERVLELVEGEGEVAVELAFE